MKCSKHGTVLTYEPGGPTMPTVLGRTYCRDCERELIAALAGLTVEQVIEVGDVPAGARPSSTVKTPAEIEADIDKVVTQYKRGVLTFGEFMLVLRASADEGLHHAAPDETVVILGGEGVTRLHTVREA